MHHGDIVTSIIVHLQLYSCGSRDKASDLSHLSNQIQNGSTARRELCLVCVVLQSPDDGADAAPSTRDGRHRGELQVQPAAAARASGSATAVLYSCSLYPAARRHVRPYRRRAVDIF
jgi:hypothetical protein